MPKLKNQRHIADTWCRNMLAQYPTALDEATMFCADKADFGAQWPDWCGFPMAASIAIITRGAPLSLSTSLRLTTSNYAAARLTAAILWSRSKGVYKFDETLAQTLLSQPVDDKIPVESLLHLPEYCCYIEYPFNVRGKQYEGMFVWDECDPHTLVPELRLLFISQTDFFSFPIILTGGSIEDSMQALIESNISRATPFHSLAKDIMPDKEELNFWGGVINMVLYLVSENRDMPVEIIKRSKDSYGNPKNPRVWTVGYRVGRAIRAYQQSSEAAAEQHRTGDSSSPRPHIRRAHYHHFWTGPRNDESKRKLIVRWLAPIPVNWDGEVDLPTVIHLVQPDSE